MALYQKKPQLPNSFIIFDFETGGLDSKKNPITEIGLISIEGGISLKKISSYQKMIAPYDEKLIYDEKALKITGITMEMIEEDGEKIETVALEILKEFEKANIHQGKTGLLPILVGHNVQFDIDFLMHLMYWGLKKTKLDYQIELEKVLHGRRDFHGNFQPTYIDTWTYLKSWFQGEQELTDYKLSTLISKLGLDINNAHRAMNDVIPTVEALKIILNTLRNGYNQDFKGKREGFIFPI